MRTRNLVLDAAVLVAYVLVSLPTVTGVATHEWAGLVLVLLLLAHAILRIGRVLPDRQQRRSPRSVRTARLVLDGGMLAALGVCAVSGVMMSGAVLPTFGLFAGGYFVWSPLHAASAKVLLALALVHVVLSVGVVARMVGRAKAKEA